MALTVLHQAGTQLDRSLWCLREDPRTCLWLAMPSAFVAGAAAAVPPLVAAHVAPETLLMLALPWATAALLAATFAGVPFAHYAYARVQGERPTAGQCFRRSVERVGPLTKLMFQLAWRYLFANLLFGLPWFSVWRRAGLAVQVALFEREANALPRCRKLLRESPAGVASLALLHIGMFVTLAALPCMPLLLDILLSKEAEAPTPWTTAWAALAIVMGWLVLVLVLASWTLSLTFLYAELRAVREGAGLWARIDELTARRAALALGGASGGAPL